ncbi:MAG: acyl--CoA ligase [Bacilli bacterium]|nr:acyl--CoA ligase [Bacilli bacterium]
MTKEELIELKKNLKDLNEEEKKELDYYLKDLATGKIQGPKVGYPTIDRPWLKLVDLDVLYKPRTKKTIYQEIYDNNRDNLNGIAIEFYGAKIKYKKLFEEIDDLARALVANGVKKGDMVTISCAGIPETTYAFYALSKIGACANSMSPFFDVAGMTERINDCDSKILLVMDQFYPSVKEKVKESTIEKIVVVPTLNSSPLRFVKPSKVELDQNAVLYNQFIKAGKVIANVKTAEYEPDMPVAMVYSSGSTGSSKAIVLSNDSFQNSIHSYEACNMDLSRDLKDYQVIPPWFSTGASTAMHLPLANGATVFMDPRFDRKVFVENVIKYKINVVVATTSLYTGFLEPELVKDADLSHFTNPFQGGEHLGKEMKEAIEKVFHDHGSPSALKIGYGQCECGAGIATQTDDFYRSDGSVGIPIPGVVCGIFDEDRNELPYNERGEIYVNTKSGMIGYYNKPLETDKFFYTDPFGTKWSCTGDIGSIDEEGNLFVYGRAEDYSMVNGEKVYNFDVEEVIAADEDIQDVDIMPVNGNGDTLVTHIVFNDMYKQLITNNPKMLYEKLSDIEQKVYDEFRNENYVPTVFKIRDEFPHALFGKRDLAGLKKETEGFIKYKEYSKDREKVREL